LFSWSEKAATWADPIGVGPQTSLALAIFAEVFCSLGIVTGLCTRLAAIPLMVTMFVASVIVHADDPWSKKELSAVYFIAFTAILVMGPGRLSLDAFCEKAGLFKKGKKK
ncbi:MAG: DoxX family protein, partial [Bdellovibrionia bacterium]